MEIPPEISFRDVDPSERHREKIREEIDKLERYFDRITRCRVVVEQPHKHSEHGGSYRIGIRLTVPTKELVVSRDPTESTERQGLDAAITDAFQAMRRQLEQYVDQMRRGRRKGGEPVRHGKVVRLMHDEGYGFIRTPDGRDVYFHENTLSSATLDDLHAQHPVWFTEEEGEKGPMAREVHLLQEEELPELQEEELPEPEE